MQGELVSDARNISHVVRGGGTELITFIEAIVTTANRKITIGTTGHVVTEEFETLRFFMSIASAKVFRDDIDKWIESAEEEHARLTLAPAE